VRFTKTACYLASGTSCTTSLPTLLLIARAVLFFFRRSDGHTRTRTQAVCLYLARCDIFIPFCIILNWFACGVVSELRVMNSSCVSLWWIGAFRSPTFDSKTASEPALEAASTGIGLSPLELPSVQKCSCDHQANRLTLASCFRLVVTVCVECVVSWMKSDRQTGQYGVDFFYLTYLLKWTTSVL